MLCPCKIYIINLYHTVIKHSRHLRTLKKCRKHKLPKHSCVFYIHTCVFYIPPVFSNACHVLSQCNTRIRFLYLLNTKNRIEEEFFLNLSHGMRHFIIYPFCVKKIPLEKIITVSESGFIDGCKSEDKGFHRKRK